MNPLARPPRRCFSISLHTFNMGAANLESLTNELFEQVVHSLNLPDIQNLRLVSRSTGLKTVQDTYRSFFREKHINLRRNDLQSFVEATSQSGLGCLVEHLSLTGIVYNPQDLQLSINTGRPRRRGGSARKVEPAHTPEQLEAIKEELATFHQRHKEDEAFRKEGAGVILLREAFSNIASSKSSPLKHLSLCIKIHYGDTVRPRSPSIWQTKQVFPAAISAFWLAMESLRSSQLKVQALDIFFNIPEQLKSSLPCNVLGNLDLNKLGSCLSTLKSLSISITDPLVHETSYAVREDDALVFDIEQPTPDITTSRDRIANERFYSALASMVERCPSIEELSIVGYKRKYSDGELTRLQETMQNRHFHHLAHGSTLPQLCKLFLADLKVRDVDLLTFLRSHVSSLRELDLMSIALSEGTFRSVVDYATGRDTRFVKIRFQDIREGNGRIGFRCDWDREQLDWPDHDIVHRWGTERKADIDYSVWGPAMLDMATIWEWTLEEPVWEEEEDDIGSVLPPNYDTRYFIRTASSVD